MKIGEELKLDVLLSNADKVEHQSRRSTEWMKIWRRTDGVQSERMSIRDRNLIISYFTARDTGTYRVLDPDEEILITETVTGERNSVNVYIFIYILFELLRLIHYELNNKLMLNYVSDLSISSTESGTESKEKVYNTDYVKSNDAIYSK